MVGFRLLEARRIRAVFIRSGGFKLQLGCLASGDEAQYGKFVMFLAGEPNSQISDGSYKLVSIQLSYMAFEHNDDTKNLVPVRVHVRGDHHSFDVCFGELVLQSLKNDGLQ